jgi:hypothetical protein
MGLTMKTAKDINNDKNILHYVISILAILFYPIVCMIFNKDSVNQYIKEILFKEDYVE